MNAELLFRAFSVKNGKDFEYFTKESHGAQREYSLFSDNLLQEKTSSSLETFKKQVCRIGKTRKGVIRVKCSHCRNPMGR